MKRWIAFLLLGMFTLPATTEVVNRDEPLNGDWDLRAETVWEMTDYGKKTMAQPNVAAVLADGTLCVFDYKQTMNYIFTGEGRFVASFGKKGEGPGEIKNQRGVFALSDGFVVVGYLRLHYFSSGGSYRETRLFTGADGYPRGFINRDEYISLGYGPDNRYELKQIDLKTPSRRLIKRIDFREVNFASTGRVITIVIPPLTPQIVCGIDPINRCIIYGRNDQYKIFQVDFNGSKNVAFSLLRESISLTRKMKKRVSKEMHLSEKMWNRLPKTLTHFSEIQIEKGYVLAHVMYFEELRPRQQIDIFSPEGRYLYRTVFSAAPGEMISTSFSYPIILKGNHIYAAIQDENGDMKVVKYKISLPWRGAD